jgi:hypothetical protein
VQIGVIEAALKLQRTYGDQAQKECDSRTSYYAMQGDQAVAKGWQRVKEHLQTLRARKS